MYTFYLIYMHLCPGSLIFSQSQRRFSANPLLDAAFPGAMKLISEIFHENCDGDGNLAMGPNWFVGLVWFGLCFCLLAGFFVHVLFELQ